MQHKNIFVDRYIKKMLEDSSNLKQLSQKHFSRPENDRIISNNLFVDRHIKKMMEDVSYITSQTAQINFENSIKPKDITKVIFDKFKTLGIPLPTSHYYDEKDQSLVCRWEIKDGEYLTTEFYDDGEASVCHSTNEEIIAYSILNEEFLKNINSYFNDKKGD